MEIRYCLACDKKDEEKKNFDPEKILEDISYSSNVLVDISDISYYKKLYQRIRIKCDKGDCELEYMMKDRETHYEKECSFYEYFKCGGTICKIKKSTEICGCIACELHDCYDIKKFEQQNVSQTLTTIHYDLSLS